MSLAKKAYRGFKWNAISNVFSILLTFIQVYILVRILEKSDFGIMAILSLIITYFISLSDFGFENAIIYEKNMSQDERSGIFSLFVLSGFSLFLFCSILSYPLAQFFEEDEIKYLLWITALALVFNGLGRFHKILLSKEMHFNVLAIIQIICVSTSFILVILLARFGFGIMSLIYAFIFNSFLDNFLSFIIGKAYYPVRLIKTSKTIFNKFFRLGKYEIGLKLSSMFLRKMDVIVLGKNFGAELLGGYEVVKNLMNKPHTVIPTIFTEVSYPIYAKISNASERITKLYRNQLHLIFLFSAPVYAFLYVMADYVVELYLGEKWLDTIPTLKIFAVVFLIRSSGIPLAGLLMSLGRVKFLFYWNLIASAITIVVLLIMIPQKELGIAKGLLVVQLIYIIPVYLLIIKKHTVLGFFEYIKIMVVPILLSMGSYAAVLYIISIKNTVPLFLLVFLIGTMLYSLLILFYLRSFDPELISLIKKYAGKSKGRNISIGE